MALSFSIKLDSEEERLKNEIKDRDWEILFLKQRLAIQGGDRQMNTYDIIISARISIGGTFEAATMEEAIEDAKLELKASGEISDIDIDRATYIDTGGE